MDGGVKTEVEVLWSGNSKGKSYPTVADPQLECLAFQRPAHEPHCYTLTLQLESQLCHICHLSSVFSAIRCSSPGLLLSLFANLDEYTPVDRAFEAPLRFIFSSAMGLEAAWDGMLANINEYGDEGSEFLFAVPLVVVAISCSQALQVIGPRS
jgi:hypothetical protein